MYGIDVALMHSLGVTATNLKKGKVILVSTAKRTVSIAVEKATANADQVNLYHLQENSFREIGPSETPMLRRAILTSLIHGFPNIPRS